MLTELQVMSRMGLDLTHLSHVFFRRNIESVLRALCDSLLAAEMKYIKTNSGRILTTPLALVYVCPFWGSRCPKIWLFGAVSIPST